MFKARKQQSRFSLTIDVQGQHYKDGLAMTVYLISISWVQQGNYLPYFKYDYALQAKDV
jgi:hypothetical protein